MPMHGSDQRATVDRGIMVGRKQSISEKPGRRSPGCRAFGSHGECYSAEVTNSTGWLQILGVAWPRVR